MRICTSCREQVVNPDADQRIGVYLFASLRNIRLRSRVIARDHLRANERCHGTLLADQVFRHQC
jgi:hypothetical protein